MKRILIMAPFIFAFILAIQFVGCKTEQGDTEIKAAVEAVLKTDPMTANTRVEVKDGIATISGQCENEMCKAKCAEIVGSVEGVNSVVNNCIITPIPSSSTEPTEEPKVATKVDENVLMNGLAEALIDVPSLIASVDQGKIVLIGEITKEKWSTLKPKLDKLVSNGYDLSRFNIK